MKNNMRKDLLAKLAKAKFLAGVNKRYFRDAIQAAYYPHKNNIVMTWEEVDNLDYIETAIGDAQLYISALEKHIIRIERGRD